MAADVCPDVGEVLPCADETVNIVLCGRLRHDPFTPGCSVVGPGGPFGGGVGDDLGHDLVGSGEFGKEAPCPCDHTEVAKDDFQPKAPRGLACYDLLQGVGVGGT
eukprot:15742278-Heterocapsa_arctica.AAC.1